MRGRFCGVVGALGLTTTVLILSGIQVAARALADPTQTDLQALLPRLAIAAALVVAGLFLFRVTAETVRCARRAEAGVWREPRPGPRRLVAYVVTGLVGLATAPPAQAHAPARVTASAALVSGAGASTSTAPDPIWHRTPEAEATTTPQIRLVGGASRTEDEAGGSVTVRRGDCLWDLVSRALGPDADDAQIASAWPRWYAANRDVIGSDPDLLLPGQILHAPASPR